MYVRVVGLVVYDPIIFTGKDCLVYILQAIFIRVELKYLIF